MLNIVRQPIRRPEMEARQTPVRIHRQDYAPFAWLVHETRLDVSIDEPDTTVCVSLMIEANPAAEATDSLVLNGRGLSLVSVQLDGEFLAADRYRLDADTLQINGLNDQHEVTITSTCAPFTNTALEGLYLSGDMLCTQCEPEGFRRICYYPDRPDVMSVFTVRIEADQKYKQLLSNGNKLEAGPAGQDSPGRHYVLWHDPHPKPCYLFALVAGDLACVEDHITTASGRDVTLQIWVEHGNQHLTGHALDSLKKSMRWDEQAYGLEYDLDLFQIVAVSHFNMGAMENKGLNIFNSKFVLADPATATDDDLGRVESIIAHEYFHNWSGNRVTCRDWFQLTLKEGLTVFRDQCFSADMHDETVKRAEDVAMLRAIQFPEDASPTAHPIRPDTYSEINNFYTPTVYEKGAEVIRMLSGFLGPQGYRRGVDLYFQRHDGQAVTCDDFLAALAEANDVDLSAFSRWYSQAGTPDLAITRQSQTADSIELRLTQNLKATAAGTATTAQPIPVRLGLVGAQGDMHSFSIDGEAAAVEQTILLTGPEQTVTLALSAPTSQPVVPSALRGFSAPVRLHDDLSVEELAVLAAHDTDGFNRYEACQRLAHLALKARLSSCELETATEEALATALSGTFADTALRDDYKALCLSVPGQSEVEHRTTDADPVAIWQARQALQGALGSRLSDLIASCLADDSTAETAAGRALRNRCLYLGVAAGMDDATQTAARQSSDLNMTLSMGGLSALNVTRHDEREACLHRFYERWKASSLVMEKWLSLGASAPYAGTIDQLGRLMGDAVFDADNPNKLRSVLGAFAMANPVQFHKADGSGYRFIADQIAEMDSRNPQIAARLALVLTRFGHIEAGRRAQMIAAVEQLSTQQLSANLGEIVAKALETAN